MRTGTVSYKLEDLKKGVIIPIGFVGENDFTKVFFDAEEIYKKYPSASVSMKVQPPKGGIYPATVTRDGNTVIWQVKEADVANRGGGELQLTFTDGETKIKTYIAKTDVKRSLEGNGPAPDPVQDFVDNANEKLEEVDDALANLAAMDNIAKNAKESDIGKSLSPKTVVDGVVTEWQYTEPSGGTDDYTNLDNKPQIAGVTLSGNKTLEDLGIASEESLGELSGEVTNVKTAIHGAEDKIENIDDILKCINVEKSNATIYLQNNKDFQYSAESSTRVSTNPLYIKNGESMNICANGFGKYAYSVSNDGEHVSSYKSFTQATEIDLTFTGPMYIRFLFANNNDSTISTSDVNIIIKNRLDEIESFYKLTPVTVLKNIDIFLPALRQYGYLGTVEGSEVSVYDVSNINKAKITRSTESVSILLSNTLYFGEATGLATYAEYYVHSVEWLNTDKYKYLYLTTKKSDTSYSAKIELTKVTDVGSSPKILESIEASAPGYVVSIETNNIGNNIVATYDNMYVRNNNGVLQLTSDKGKTWNNGIDVSSLEMIKSYHLFANGCIAFFTHQHAYYSEDWEEYHEATVYEKDGITPYVPSTYDNFLCSRDNKERKFIGTQDLYVFSNYGINPDNPQRRIIWLSDDNGHTYKVIYEFNVQDAISIRHVHNIIYNKDYDRYICCTGDESYHSHVIEINIDGVNDPTFTVKGTGLDYKWAGVVFYGAYVYYCMDNTPGQVKRCKYQDIGDITKHEIVLDNLPNDAIGLFIGERGDMLVTLTKYRSNGTTNSPFSVDIDKLRMYYSKDRKEFTDFIADKQTNYSGMYYMFNSVNSDGIIIAGYWEDRIDLQNWDRLPSASLDKMVKKAGFPMAFRPYDRSWEIVPVVDVLCEDVTVASGGSVTIQPKLFPVDASSLAFSIIDYDSSVVSVNGATITGVAQGTTTAKVRSNLCYDAYAEITITVT